LLATASRRYTGDTTVSKMKQKAKVARLSVATPILPYTLDGISRESVTLASSIFPTLSVGKARILAALALCGNNAPHRKVALVAGAFHRVATPKGCAACRATMRKAYAGRCAGNDLLCRVTVSGVGDALKVDKGGSRADRVANLWAAWLMGLGPKARAAQWARIGKLNA
jgi:hypothetical protein